MDVAILGAGPAAAYAARACLDVGIRPTIYADKKVSPLGGAFWLYMLPESILPYYGKPPSPIHITSVGQAENYARKMWNHALPTSFPEKRRIIQGYSPVEGLGLLWGDLTLSQGKLSDRAITALAKKHQLVIQTFPSEKSVSTLGAFRSPLYIVNKRLPDWDPEHSENAVLYDGSIFSKTRLRHSLLFGWESTEYSRKPAEVPEGARLVVGWKLHPQTPEWTTTLAPNVHLVGRFATWKRKTLSHEAYGKTLEILRPYLNSGESSNSSTHSFEKTALT